MKKINTIVTFEGVSTHRSHDVVLETLNALEDSSRFTTEPLFASDSEHNAHFPLYNTRIDNIYVGKLVNDTYEVNIVLKDGIILYCTAIKIGSKFNDFTVNEIEMPKW